jgi:hypothetical protein
MMVVYLYPAGILGRGGKERDDKIERGGGWEEDNR